MISVNLHNPTKSEHRILDTVDNDVVQFVDAEGNYVSILTIPHVAKAVADAFTKAMAREALIAFEEENQS